MSAVPSPASKGVQQNAPTTFRAIIDSKRADGGRMGLDDAIAVIVPVCLDLKDRHAKGESHYVHPSSIAKGPDGLYRLNPQLAINPKDPRDRATLAPEVLRSNGPGGARASVFAVGAMLYEAVCGTPVGPGMRRPRDVDPKLPELLVCPLPNTTLIYDAAARELISTAAGLAFPIRNGVPLMIEDAARKLTDDDLKRR